MSPSAVGLRRLARARWAPVVGLALPAAYLVGACAGDDITAGRVDAMKVAQVVITPDELTLKVGETAEFAAFALTATGDTAPANLVWSAARGSVQAQQSTGRGKRSGHYRSPARCGPDIVAVSDGEGHADTAAVTVTTASGGLVTVVTVSPAAASVEVGSTVELSATVLDCGDEPVGDAAVIWESSPPGIVEISADGLVTGGAPGDATITATSDGESGTAAITVTEPSAAPVASVTLSPAAASLEVGATVQLTAVLKDADGNTLSGRAVTWTSDPMSVAAVSTSGLVTAMAPGDATITATSEGKNGTAAITVAEPPPPPSATVVLVGAGDIADCGVEDDEATAQLLDAVIAEHPSATVFTAGDNAYDDGTTAEFAACYDPTWGRHKARTRPSPGNHDYNTSGASGYFEYFGSLAGPSGLGYYSYDIGEWHVISLNSEITMSAGSLQEQWLRADLAATPRLCTIAYLHRPRFSSGSHGSDAAVQPIWEALYEAGAEILVVGHDHHYERFAPQTASGARDDATGIRQFVVGTGGRSLRSVSSPTANSEALNADTHGVLKLALSADSYTWEFIPEAGSSFRDSGGGRCH